MIRKHSADSDVADAQRQTPNITKLPILMDLGMAFGYIWIIGSLCTYFCPWPIANVINEHLAIGRDDSEGTFGFTIAVLVVGSVLLSVLSKRRHEFRLPFPAARSFVLGAVDIALPNAFAWLLITLWYNFQGFKMPYDAAWMQIAAFTTCGMMSANMFKTAVERREQRPRPHAVRADGEDAASLPGVGD